MRSSSRWCFLSALMASAAVADSGTWNRIGPEGGNFSAVAVDPDEPGRTYAISNHQAYGRTAAGRSWQPLDLPYSDAIVAYAGGRVYVGSSGGLHRSRDHGGHFERLPVPGIGVLQVVADRDDPDVVYIAVYASVQGGGGVYRSGDGGATWSSPGSGLPGAALPFALAVDPADGDTVYAAVLDQGVFVSRDGTATWSGLNEGLPCPASPSSSDVGCIVSLALVPGDTPTLLVGAYHGGLLRSIDGGATWRGAQGDIDTEIVTALAAAGDAGTVYAGIASGDGFGDDNTTRFRVLRSSDGGSSWRAVSDATFPAAVASLAASSSGGDTVFAATGEAQRRGLGFAEGAGLYRSSDGAASWQLDQSGLTGTCLGQVAAAPTAMTTLHALAQYDPVRIYSQPDAGSWDGIALPSSFIAGLDVDPNDPRRVYAIASDGILSASADGGVSWQQIAPDGSLPFIQVYDLAVDGRDGSSLYVAAAPSTGDGLSRRIYASRDGGRSWRDTLTLPNVNLTSKVVVDPGSNAVYALSDTALFRSRDAGESWEQLVQTSVSEEELLNLTVAPTIPPTLLRESTSGLRISPDDGRSWNEPRFPGVREPVYITAVSVDPSRALTLYTMVSDQDGQSALQRSDDGGGAWTAVVDAPQAFTTALAVDPHDRRIVYAATCGTGVQMLTQSSATSSSGDTHGCAIVAQARPSGWVLGAHVIALGLLLAARRAGAPRRRGAMRA